MKKETIGEIISALFFTTAFFWFILFLKYSPLWVWGVTP